MTFHFKMAEQKKVEKEIGLETHTEQEIGEAVRNVSDRYETRKKSSEKLEHNKGSSSRPDSNLFHLVAESLLRIRRQWFNSKDFPSYDGVVKRKLFTIFEKYIVPSNVINVFWKYDPHVLTKRDIELVEATVHTSGIAFGALKLLELLSKYKKWILCLIRVLEDEKIELDHVAEMIFQEIEKIKSDTSLETTVKALAEKDLSEMSLELESFSEMNSSYSIWRKVCHIFEDYINPRSVVHVFWKHDPTVLEKEDIEYVEAVTKRKGMAAGAEALFRSLSKYENWLPCLIQALRDKEVNQEHVAERILDAIYKIKYDTSVPIEMKYLAEKDVQIMRQKMDLESFSKMNSSYNEFLKRKVCPIFTDYINPRSVVHVFWKCDPKVLRKEDIEYVEAVTKRKGMAAGAEALFRSLSKYKNWLLYLVQALRDEEVNQEHVAEWILNAIYNIKHDASVPIEVKLLAEKDVQIVRLKIDLEKKKYEENETITKLNQQIQEMKMMLGTDRTNEKGLAEDNTLSEESQTKLATDDLLNVILRDTKELTMKESLMLYFAKCGQLKALEDLIEGDDNINTDKCDSEGKTVLMYAASAGSLECVTLIVGRNPDVTLVDNRGQTPLIVAARSKGDNIQCLQKLLDAGADVNVKDTLGNTALAYAAKEGNVQCVQALVDSGTDVNTSDKYGKTPLMLASRSNAECVEILLKAGASPDVKDADQPALIHAVNFGNVGCVQVLLKVGSDVNISDKMGKTALMFAAEHSGDYVPCLQKLLDAGADVDTKDQKGSTALAYAASTGNVNCVQLLLRSGGQKHLNTPDINGRTPLMLASKSNGDKVQCVKTLLSSGADINMKDSDGQTALDYAIKCGNIKCQDLLHFFKMKLLFSNTE